MVNLVIVSHSSRLGEGVGELARQMLMSDSCKIAIAAGIDDPQNPIGTDAVKVMEAIESVADADHVLVMMDMGSALLSAETALELLALKEKMMRMKIGAYRNTNTNAMKMRFPSRCFRFTASPPVPHRRRNGSSPAYTPPQWPSSQAR